MMVVSSQARLRAVANVVGAKAVTKPRVGVVLGSGLGAFGDALEESFPYADLPGMPTSTVPGHAGKLRLGNVGGVGVACLQGRVHLYEGHDPNTVVFGARLLALLGCRAVILTNAAGGIAEHFAPGDRMLITDHLNLTGQSPLTGPSEELPQSTADGAFSRFVDMSHAYDAKFGELAHRAAKEAGTTLHEGVYAGLLGPSYETPAEVRMLHALGAHAVGMSTVLEVVALRHLNVRVCAISCITNMAAGISKMPLHHAEVQAIANRTSGPFVTLLQRLVALVGEEVKA